MASVVSTNFFWVQYLTRNFNTLEKHWKWAQLINTHFKWINCFHYKPSLVFFQNWKYAKYAHKFWFWKENQLKLISVIVLLLCLQALKHQHISVNVMNRVSTLQRKEVEQHVFLNLILSLALGTNPIDDCIIFMKTMAQKSLFFHFCHDFVPHIQWRFNVIKTVAEVSAIFGFPGISNYC